MACADMGDSDQTALVQSDQNLPVLCCQIMDP